MDAQRSPEDPVVEDLVGATLAEKHALNAMGDLNGGKHVCARISRVNHDCWGNASHSLDETFRIV